MCYAWATFSVKSTQWENSSVQALWFSNIEGQRTKDV